MARGRDSHPRNWLLAGAAFAVNSLIEKHIDGKNGAHTDAPASAWRLSAMAAIAFSGLLGGVGMWLGSPFRQSVTMC